MLLAPTTGAGRRLREALVRGEQVVAPGVYDALTARVVADLGFAGVYLGGFASSAPRGLMEPLMTMSEQIGLAREVVGASGQLPVIVDGHTGYGEAAHVTRAVREFEAAGVAAIHLEDQVFPKRAGYHDGQNAMVPVEEMEVRLQAAVHARTDLMVIARTEARGVSGSVDEVIARLRAYAEVGADALMPMVGGADEARAVREAIPDVPMLWAAGLGRFVQGKEVSVSELRAIGYQIVITPLVAVVAAVDAVRDLYQRYHEAGVLEVASLDRGYGRILDLIGAPDFYEIERRCTLAEQTTGKGEPDES